MEFLESPAQARTRAGQMVGTCLQIVVVLAVNIAKVAFSGCPAAQSLTVLELHNVVKAAGYATVAAYVVAKESYRYVGIYAAVYLILIYDRRFVLVADTGACGALGVKEIAAFVNLIIFFVGVSVTQWNIQLLRFFASPLGNGSGFLCRLDSLFNCIYCFLFLLWD